MEDTRPKFLESVAEHPDVQRLIKQVVRSDLRIKELQAENERLKEALIAADKTFDAYYEGREGQECASAVKVKQALKGDT